MRYETVVGIGGNIGDTLRRFTRLTHFLRRERLVVLRQSSVVVKNPPFGYLEQEDFYNAVLLLRTNLPPQKFLAYLQHIERRFGRKRTFANAPRTLDLDIIFFHDRVMRTKRLTIPHGGFSERLSVLLPLSTIRRGR